MCHSNQENLDVVQIYAIWFHPNSIWFNIIALTANTCLGFINITMNILDVIFPESH